MEIKFEQDDLEGGKYLSEGEHECRIASIEQKASSKKGEPMLEITFASPSGKTTRDWFMLVGKKFKLAELALATGTTKEQLLAGQFTTESLAGKHVKVIRKIAGEEMYKDKMVKKYDNEYAPSSLAKSPANSEDIPF